MPRTLKEIKEIASLSSINNIQNDPAHNSVLGNIKKLHDMLGEYDKFETNLLREQLGSILDGAQGKASEADTDKLLNMLHGTLHAVYLVHGAGRHGIIKDEQKRKEFKNLLEYVAAGLKDDEGFEISDEQRRNIAHREEQQKLYVREEKVDAEREARRKALEGKSALNVLDEHKAAVGRLPKSFSGPNAKAEEEEARKQLKALCVDIMATRRTVEAKRNNKSGLAAAQVDAELLKTNKEALGKNKTLDKFLKRMSYSDLRSLVYSGHGGALEDKFKAYLLKNVDSIPADAPYEYMPTAKQRTEALIDKMKTGQFQLRTSPGDQRKLYIEMMATRAAVNSKRGDKKSLDFKVTAAAIDEERKKFAKEPLKTALVRITAMGDRQESAWDAATSGHGGALEDKVRSEIRSMSVSEEYGFRLQNVDKRYAPTAQQRFIDIHSHITGRKMSDQEILRASMEAGILKDQIDEGKGDEVIDNIESYNRQIDEKCALYSKVMDYQSLKDFVMDSVNYGNDSASSKFEAVHAGPLAAIRLDEKISEELNKGPEKADLAKLAAQKMTLLKANMQYQEDKDGEKLANALDKTKLEKDVSTLMSHHLFKEMCEKLGPEGLAKYTKGDGSKLVESFELARQDKLEPYKPEAPAAVKNEQVKEQPAPGINIG